MYFMNSPFFDHTSNNGTVNNQANYNPNLWNILQDRQRFEAHLRGMTGVEYMVADGPTDEQQLEKPTWVIRKQERKKRAGQADEITLLATYYVVGENISQAPSVEKVLSGRLMSLTKCMSEFLDVATTLPLFTSATGHRYLSASAEKSKKAGHGSRSSSRAGSVAPSPGMQIDRAASPEPGSDGSKAPRDNTDAYEDLRLLNDSLNLTLRYRDEYMDENPIHGEPGAFVFAQSTEHLKARQQAEKARLEAATAKATSAPTSTRNSGPPTPLPELKTQGLSQARKGSKGDAKSPVSAGAPKLKRKKTGKGTVNSPGSQSPT